MLSNQSVFTMYTFIILNVYMISDILVAPDGPPADFHVVVLNSTAIEAQWNIPSFNQRNGLIRGYILFVQQVGGIEEEIDVNNTAYAITYVVNDLLPDTAYVVSVLAYTMVGLEGPRSIHLTARTYSFG